jgi:hypothetical protein
MDDSKNERYSARISRGVGGIGIKVIFVLNCVLQNPKIASRTESNKKQNINQRIALGGNIHMNLTEGSYSS